MKKQTISLLLCILFLFVCTSCSHREINLISDKQNDDYSYNEDISADYSYSVELFVDGESVSNGKTISAQNNLEHTLKIKDYVGAEYPIGLIITANGVPISFEVDDHFETMYVFEPAKRTINFSFDAMNYSGSKIDIVLISELERTPKFYLDSIHNYSNSIYYVLSGEVRHNQIENPDNCVVSPLSDEKKDETNGIVATITKNIGYSTDKYLDYTSAKEGLYVNLYGQPGDYSVITFAGREIYNGFGNTSNIQLHIEEGQFISLPIVCSQINQNDIEQIFCIIVPCDTKITGIFDTPMVQIIGNNKMSINEASHLSMRIDVSERKIDWTEERIDIDLTPIGSPAEHRFRLLCIADGILQNFNVNGEQYNSYNVELNKTISLSIKPNVSCKTDDSFVLTFFLVVESTAETYSEEYMLDPATKTMRADVLVINKYANVEKDHSNRKNEEGISSNSGISRWSLSSDSVKDDRFCSFVELNKDSCSMTYTYVPQARNENRYLTIFLLNGEVISLEDDYTSLMWSGNDNKGLTYALEVDLNRGLNRLCAITVSLDNNDIEVTRIKVLVSNDMITSDVVAVSSAIGKGESLMYLGAIDDVSIKYRISVYGFMTVNSGQSGTKRINQIGTIEPGKTTQIDIIDAECNTFSISFVAQTDNVYTFVKYYTYGRTN